MAASKAEDDSKKLSSKLFVGIGPSTQAALNDKSGLIKEFHNRGVYPAFWLYGLLSSVPLDFVALY